MSKIFITYRRDDSGGWAFALHDRLVEAFGRDALFMDVDTLRPGEDFVDVIDEVLESCRVVLAVIGNRWVDATDAQGRRRLDRPEDLVAIEVATALERDVRVVPVLVDGAAMPDAEELPERLQALTRRHATALLPASFHRDVSQLIETIRPVVEATEPLAAEASPPAERPPTAPRRPVALWVGAVALLLILFLGFLVLRPGPGDDDDGGGSTPPADTTTTTSTTTPTTTTAEEQPGTQGPTGPGGASS